MNEICDRLREEALEGQASEELRQHAAACSDCSEFLSKLDALSSDLAGMPPRDASDELVATLLARPEVKAQRGTSWRVFAGVAAAMVGIASALQVSMRSDSSRRFGYVLRSPASAPAPKEEVAAPLTQ
jgi:hypothetical protein